jgi:TonB family protein
MNRLQKKCVIASGIAHATLVLVLLVGPAFLGSDDPTIDAKDIIDFIPFKTLEQNMTGGGNPNVAQVIPAPAPPTPTPPTPPTPPPPAPRVEQHDPTPEPPKPAQREVQRTVPDNSKPDPDALEPAKRSAPKISLTQVTRNTSTSRSSDTAKAQRDRDRAAARERAESVDRAISAINAGASGSVKVDELRGPGGGGVPYAGFNPALVSAYMRAWLVPADLANSSAKVVAKITLNRNGDVISARIERSSGNADLDESVRRALDKVSYVAPFPESMKDTQKTFWLEFDPRAKRMMG